MASNYTLCITSCDRHDLLKRTLESFIQMVDLQPQETFIVEDGPTPMPYWLKENIHYFASRLGKITWINNDCRMGQIYSADRLMALVKTDYVFWLEDDWEFTQRGFLRDSKQILDSHPSVIQISLRGDTGWHPLLSDSRFAFKLAEPGWREGWGGFSFNPGLRRRADYQRIGSYGRHTSYGTSGLGHEMELSKLYLGLGYVIADLGRPIAVHTGGGRSRAVEPLAAMPKVLIAIPVCHRYNYGKWESEQSPSFNLANAYNGRPYGTDIHISGKNNRIAALRETWLKDIEPFKAHVDYKLFYGRAPEDSTCPGTTDIVNCDCIPKADEVFLNCPDDYEHLPNKTIEICRWAVENGYDYLFKADDDSYVWVDRLIHELMTNRFDYAGYTHSNVCTGGPGYWLSKRAMKEVSRNGIQDHWAEDVTVGKIMNHANIYPVHLPTHCPGFSAHWFNIDQLKGGEVCIHAVQPDTMIELYRREHREEVSRS